VLSLSKNDNPTADDFVTQLSQLQVTTKPHLQEAQDCYKAYANKLRKESPSFQIGDKVWFI